MSYIVKSMVVECPVAGRTREVAFANGCLVIKDVDPMEFLPLVHVLSGASPAVPVAASPVVETTPATPEPEPAAAEPPAEESKVLGKRRAVRKPAPKKSPEATPTSKKEPEPDAPASAGTGTASNPRSVVAEEGSPALSAPVGTSALNGTGSASSPRKVQSEAAVAAAPEDGELDDIEPDDDTEPVDAEPDDISAEDIPDGWAREMMDGKMTTYHVACGAAVCLCSITEESRVAAKPNPVIEVEDKTADEPDDSDPLLVELRGAKRLLKVVDKLMEAGFKTPDEIIAQCDHYRTSVPLLARISDSQWQERIAVALEVSGL